MGILLISLLLLSFSSLLMFVARGNNRGGLCGGDGRDGQAGKRVTVRGNYTQVIGPYTGTHKVTKSQNRRLFRPSAALLWKLELWKFVNRSPVSTVVLSSGWVNSRTFSHMSGRLTIQVKVCIESDMAYP